MKFYTVTLFYTIAATLLLAASPSTASEAQEQDLEPVTPRIETPSDPSQRFLRAGNSDSTTVLNIDNDHRQLYDFTPVISGEYKYQEKKRHAWCLGLCGSWKDTGHKWCVESDQNSCFVNPIGGSFFDVASPDTRIVQVGNWKSGGCEKRSDIGSGSCKYDEDYKGISACSGDKFNLYKC